MNTTIKLSEKKIIYEGKFLRFCQQNHWEFAERTHAGSAVIIIAKTPQNNLLFVEQFRIPLGANTI
ncbi:MAG: DNA mismatch repair protein MutT, partial [Arenimonas sp.]|nr:DNA mismatch repair protein MutT [Arenimonas sp.]